MDAEESPAGQAGCSADRSTAAPKNPLVFEPARNYGFKTCGGVNGVFRLVSCERGTP
jgi:hypothetical protein